MKVENGGTVLNDINVKHKPSIPALQESLRRPGVQFFLYFLFFMALSWPLLSISDGFGFYGSTFAYIFGIWSVMIAVLFLVARCCLKPRSSSKTMEKEQAPGC